MLLSANWIPPSFRGALLCFWMLLLFVVSFSSAEEKRITVEVTGGGECSEYCKKNNIKTRHAVSGLRVTIDCKSFHGHYETRGEGNLDEEGLFHVSLPGEIVEDGKLKEECFAQLHSASSSAPCPAINGVECSKIVFKSRSGDKHTFEPVQKIKFSPETCTSEFLWPFYKLPPLIHDHPFFHKIPHPTWRSFGFTFPPKVFPPFPLFKKPLPPITIFKKPCPPLIPKEPLPPPVPVYVKPIPPPVPVYVKPIPPPVPVYVKPIPPPVPVYKKPNIPPPVPVYKKPFPPPVPVYKKPLPPPVPVYKKPLPPPVYKKTLPPTVPVYKKPIPPSVYKKPLPPPVPVYTKPLPPPVPVYKKPLPPLVPIYKKPLPPLIPIYKKPCPPFIPKIPLPPHIPIFKKPLPPLVPVFKHPFPKVFPPKYLHPFFKKPFPHIPIIKPLPPFKKKPYLPIPKFTHPQFPPFPTVPPKH